MNTSNNNLADFLRERFEEIKESILRNIRIILPVVVIVIAAITLTICLVAHNKKAKEEAQAEEAAAETTQESVEASADTSISVPEVPLEKNAYPALNELMNNYYTAMAEGDIDTLKSMNQFLDDTEIIRIEETAKYVNDYESIDVYSKTGPSEGTYIAYVYSEVKFKDFDAVVPGIQAYYVCTDDSGNLYINDGEESETVVDYIREVSLQDDLVDLNNEVAVAYNDMLASDDDLSVFLSDLFASIDNAVGEKLAEAEEGTNTATSDEETGETTEETDDEESQTGVTASTVTTVKTITTVNVRSSDSETADKLGKAAEGEEFTLIEERGNGWSEIDYNGKNAFIKSEYLEKTGTQTIIDTGDTDTADKEDTAANTTETAKKDTKTETKTETKTDTAAETKTETSAGTVTVKESVRIRASASETADKLGTAYAGEKLELVMKQADGWTKIKYNGQTAYVKSDYVE